MAAQPRGRFTSIASVAEEYEVTTKFVRTLIAQGDLRAYRVGSSKMIRLDRAEVASLLKPIPTAGSGSGHAA